MVVTVAQSTSQQAERPHPTNSPRQPPRDTSQTARNPNLEPPIPSQYKQCHTSPTRAITPNDNTPRDSPPTCHDGAESHTINKPDYTITRATRPPHPRPLNLRTHKKNAPHSAKPRDLPRTMTSQTPRKAQTLPTQARAQARANHTATHEHNTKQQRPQDHIQSKANIAITNSHAPHNSQNAQSKPHRITQPQHRPTPATPHPPQTR